jgi:tetratricopeptide (TPR) repeat protein
MHSITLDSVVEELNKALRAGNLQLAEELLWPALDQRPATGALWFYAGTIFAAKGLHAVGLECFLKSAALDPHPAVWSNAGACLRYMQDLPSCRKILEIGLDHVPDDAHLIANLSGSYVNEGNPWPGIALGERIANDPEAGPAAKFNLALLYLEAGDFARGFECYATGHHTHRELRAYTPDPPALTRELHDQLKGQGKRLLVYGEQGLGDELMFATMLEQARLDYEIVFDCHPRLLWLLKNARWAREGHGYPITFHDTRKNFEADKGWQVSADAKAAIGNLGRFYRNDASKFTWPGAWYTAPGDLVTRYRAHLRKLAGGRKIIGLATRGGTLQTARLYRMMPMEALEQLFANEEHFFVSLDYEDMSALAEWAVQKHGAGRYLWNPSVVWHWDYHHTAALVAATDAVVTVTQTVAHLSSAMDHPTYVLTPSRPDWRMGLTGETWCWYPTSNTRLLRQIGDSWQPALTRLFELLEARPLASDATKLRRVG